MKEKDAINDETNKQHPEHLKLHSTISFYWLHTHSIVFTLAELESELSLSL